MGWGGTFAEVFLSALFLTVLFVVVPGLRAVDIYVNNRVMGMVNEGWFLRAFFLLLVSSSPLAALFFVIGGGGCRFSASHSVDIFIGGIVIPSLLMLCCC